MENPEGKFPASFETYQEVNSGDFVFCMFDNEETPRAVGLSSLRGMITGAYDVMSLIAEGVSREFLNYYFLWVDEGKRLKPLYKGLRKTVPLDSFLAYKISLPPLPEQKAIVAYLDAETERIDKAIAAEEKMIALLQERREIVINEAVGECCQCENVANAQSQYPIGTGNIGTGNTSTMATFACLPKGWKMRRLKTLATCNDETLPENTSDFVRIEYIEISDVDESRGIFNSTFHVFKDAPSRARRITRKGDVIISTVRTYLKAIATIEREGLVVSTGFAVLRARTSVLPRFLAYAVKSAVFKDNVVRYSTGTSYPAINASDLMCLSVPLPPLPEQEAIVERLDRETGKIDRAIEVKRRQIELLRERRQIVIDEVVTGKVKVA